MAPVNGEEASAGSSASPTERVILKVPTFWKKKRSIVVHPNRRAVYFNESNRRNLKIPMYHIKHRQRGLERSVGDDNSDTRQQFVQKPERKTNKSFSRIRE